LLHHLGWPPPCLCCVLSGNATDPVTTALLLFVDIFTLASVISGMALINHYYMVPAGGLAMGHHFGTKPDGNDSKR